MTPLEQLEKWVNGENIHNPTRDECCPDFACCQPNNHFSKELRIKFLETYRQGGAEAVEPMLMMALSGVTASSGKEVYLAGTMDHGTQ
jgi:hypothetical protein